MNISVFDPESVGLASLLSTVETSGGVVAGPSWVTFGEGVVYRWTSDALAGDLTCDLTQPELAQIWEGERRLTNLPKLLFSLDGHRITIRFHPQHARLPRVASVREPFLTALHRSHPDCRITWVL